MLGLEMARKSGSRGQLNPRRDATDAIVIFVSTCRSKVKAEQSVQVSVSVHLAWGYKPGTHLHCHATQALCISNQAHAGSVCL